jgi:hypothetical protein
MTSDVLKFIAKQLAVLLIVLVGVLVSVGATWLYGVWSLGKNPFWRLGFLVDDKGCFKPHAVRNLVLTAVAIYVGCVVWSLVKGVPIWP